MCDADLSQKIWGWKATTHFFVAAAIRAGLAFLFLLAVFDYAGLPEAEADKVRETFWEEFMNNFLIHFMSSGFILSWLLCPSRCWYGFLSILQIFYGIWFIPLTTIRLKNYISAQNGQNYEYFKFGMFGFFGYGYASAASGIYIGLFLMRLSFLSPPKQRDLYVVHVIHSTNNDDSSSSSTKKSEETDSESQKSPVV